MPQVISVKFRYSPKHLWFDPQNTTYQAGEHVLVETERGREVGLVMDGNIQATDEQIAQLKTPLKPAIRQLTELDFDHVDALEQKGRDALPQFRELVEKHKLDMKPVEVEYLFSGDRAVFFFSSDERVDFRELVRDLSSQFHVRVDMRQIGARDEARMIGGIGHCGEELCCARFGGDFQPVSIRMAKEQDLPLNPTKISGACGRLMCCLRYEYEAYKDFKKRAPKKGTLVNTPLGTSKIIGYDTLREMLQLRLEDGKTISVPMAEMICEQDSKGCKQCSVSRETIDSCASSSMLLALSALDREQEQLEDKLGGDFEPEVFQRSDQASKGRKRRQRNDEQKTGAKAGSGASRNTSTSSSYGASADTSAQSAAADKDRSRPRPGQRSSGLRKRRLRNNNGEQPKNNQNAGAQATDVRGASTQNSNNSSANAKANRASKNNNGNANSNGNNGNDSSNNSGNNSNHGRRRRRNRGNRSNGNDNASQ